MSSQALYDHDPQKHPTLWFISYETNSIICHFGQIWTFVIVPNVFGVLWNKRVAVKVNVLRWATKKRSWTGVMSKLNTNTNIWFLLETARNVCYKLHTQTVYNRFTQIPRAVIYYARVDSILLLRKRTP